MAFVPIRIDRTSKPPIGTPLRSDGHWSVQGLVGAWAFNEGAGITAFDARGEHNGSLQGSATLTQQGLKGRVYLGNDNSLHGLNGLTIITGFYNPSGTIEGALFGSVSYDWYYYLLVSNTSESIGFGVMAGGGKQAMFGGGFGNLDFTIGKLTRVAVTWNKAIATLLVNDDIYRSGAATAQIPSNSDSISIGSRGDSGLTFTEHIPYSLFYKHGDFTRQQIASLSNNPWQIYEPETVWIEVGGGAEAALFAGTIYGQSSVSAQLSTAIAIASQVVAVGSISGGINTAIRLATSTQGSALASALLTTAIRMAAGAQGYGASTADLSTTIALAADILAASSASGTLSTAIRFGGALSGASTTTAALTNAIALAAQAAGLGSISGQLAGTVAAALFAGTIQGSSSASANLSTAVILAAAAQGNSTAQATLSTALELAAQVNGIGSAAGTLGADISGLAGSLDGSSEAQATLATAIHLMGVAAGQCGIIGRLAEPVEILAQLRVMASDPLALTISVRDPLTLNIAVST